MIKAENKYLEEICNKIIQKALSDSHQYPHRYDYGDEQNRFVAYTKDGSRLDPERQQWLLLTKLFLKEHNDNSDLLEEELERLLPETHKIVVENGYSSILDAAYATNNAWLEIPVPDDPKDRPRGYPQNKVIVNGEEKQLYYSYPVDYYIINALAKEYGYPIFVRRENEFFESVGMSPIQIAGKEEIDDATAMRFIRCACWRIQQKTYEERGVDGDTLISLGIRKECMDAYYEAILDQAYEAQQEKKEEINKEINNRVFIPFGTDPEKDKMVKSDDYKIRMEVAKQNYGLEILKDDKDPRVQSIAEQQGYCLEALLDAFSNSKYTDIRCALAKEGFCLDKFVNDKSWEVRREVALKGYGLDVLVHDSNSKVREVIAQQGYGLDILVNDEDSRIREIVALQGYGLDILANDEDARVSDIAKALLNRQEMEEDKDEIDDR